MIAAMIQSNHDEAEANDSLQFCQSGLTRKRGEKL